MAQGRNINNQRGFTLIEVLMASFITLIVLMSLLMTIVMGRYSSTLARHKSQAVQLSQQRMEQMKSLGYSTLAAMSQSTPTITETGVVLDGDIDSRPDMTCTRATTLADDSPDSGVLEVTVQVSWQEKSMGGNINVSEEVYSLVADTSQP